MVNFTQRLLGEMIAVEPEVAPRGKILLPDWQRNLRGQVVATGPDARETKVGDTVLFGAATGMETQYKGVSIRIMRDSDVDAVIGS
jgi:co-chaperonin GroES (HSP10)